MLTRFPDLVYPDSPFLPMVTFDHLDLTKKEIKEKRRPTSVAISLVLMAISLEINHYHLKDYQWVTQTFKANYEDLDLFMFGFTIAPSFIVGAYIFDIVGPKEAFRQLCPVATDPLLARLNQYKGGQLFHCYRLYHISKYNSVVIEKIFEHCQANTFSLNKFYLAGIDASENLFQTIIQRLHPL